jgi:thioredoxin 1
MIAVNDASFNEALTGVSLVVFSTAACAPCRALGMVFGKTEKKIAEMGIKVYKADLDGCRTKAGELKVSALPSVHLFRDGAQIKSFCGLKTAPQLMEFLADVAAEVCQG